MASDAKAPPGRRSLLIDRAVKWVRLLSETSLWQIAIAALGFVSGIAVVRLLDVEEYAVYTIANSLLGALVVLGDSGLSTAVMSQGGSVWQDRDRLGVLMNTALAMCRWFAVAAALVAIPAAIVLLGRHGSPLGVSLAVALILIPCFVLSIRNTIFQIPIKLYQDVRPLQAIQCGSNILRLVVLGALLPFAPYTLVALGAAAVSTAYANFRTSRRANLYMFGAAQSDPIVRKGIMRIAWRMLPGSIYHCVQGQLTIWLISVFGNTVAVAQLGALGRLGVVTSVISAVATTLVVPRFARLPELRRLLLGRILVILSILALMCGIGLVVVALFSDVFLWVLGSAYRGLRHELMLMAIASALALISGILVSLCFSRGLIPNPIVTIPFGIIIQVVFVVLNDMATLKGVLLMSVGISASMVAFFAVYLCVMVGRGIRIHESV